MVAQSSHSDYTTRRQKALIIRISMNGFAALAHNAELHASQELLFLVRFIG
jgi:hypothetical protein